ncbi:MAG: coenzyme F420-0:L-glutamate ligase [Anaerolineae bacterium]|nr:coenzyme F420-0:L-glutamate ligase [Anaerolineae bacterium]
MDAVTLTITTLPGIPLVEPGDDLVQLMMDGLAAGGLNLQAGDVLVVTSKIVSKSEGRLVRLAAVKPGARAEAVAAEVGKDPRIVELILSESRSISRQAPNVLITEHRLGFISANAGIDQSNVPGYSEYVLLLPVDPDASARRLREQLRERTGVEVGIIISDSHGRPFRVGTVGVAIGVAGLPAVLDLRGQPDLFGRELRISMQGYADMIASTAQLVSGEGAEGLPVTLVRGLRFPAVDGSARDLQRDPDHDLYR